MPNPVPVRMAKRMRVDIGSVLQGRDTKRFGFLLECLLQPMLRVRGLVSWEIVGPEIGT